MSLRLSPATESDQSHGPHCRKTHILRCRPSHGTPVHWPQRNKPQTVAFGAACPDFHIFSVPLPSILTIWGCIGLKKELTNICFKGEEIYIVQEMVPNIKGDNFYCHTWLREDEICLVTKGREVGEMGRCWSKGRKLYLT